MDVIVTHPYFGTVYLADARFDVVQRPGKRRQLWVVGEAWDDSELGAANLPEDYRGQPMTMNFPATCIKEVVH